MCGICGMVMSDTVRDAALPVLRRMLDTIVHRGPDDEGHYLAGPVALGMRRLSIIDIEGGKQPIHNEDSTVQVVYNGEIYNHLALRSELESLGHRFYTRSDTEVIVHAYEEYGEACVEKLRGMFAIAIWDLRQRSLLLTIDRFGIKPLYYARTPSGLVFGSELKCLVASGMVDRKLDMAALSQYFTLGYIPPPATIFKGVHKLEPGHRLVLNRSGDIRRERYWDVPVVDHGRRRPPLEQTRRDLRELLRDSVKAHLISDVPLGAFLSGGIDSSIVVALMSEVMKEPVKTFSIGFADREHNELDLAREVARKFRTDHHELIVEPETVDVLPRLVGHFDEPFADSSALPTYYVSKMARQFVKVALSGDGGDELFVGYSFFRGIELARYAQKAPGVLRRFAAQMSGSLPSLGKPAWDDRVSRFQKRLGDTLMTSDDAYRSKLGLTGIAANQALLSAGLRSELARHDPHQLISEQLARFPSANGAHPLERFVYAGLKVSLPGDMLVKVDRMSMANSLEVRVPLLDHVLAEYACSIPINERFPRWRLKGLLKDTMADVLPPRILSHPKHGFTVPLNGWFRGDLGAFAAEVLLDAKARQRGFFDAAALESLLRDQRQSGHSLGPLLWSLIIFELWCRQSLN